MDKYYGISRAEIISAEHSYEIALAEESQICKNKKLPRQIAGGEINRTCGVKSKVKNAKGKGFIFTIFRYGMCATLLLICFLSRLIEPLKEASTFIKDELNRDIITEITEIVNEVHS